MTLDVQCPLCGATMERMPDTEWTDGRTRTVDVLCPRCLHRETVYLSVRRDRPPKT